jgi:hypothetical protein
MSEADDLRIRARRCRDFAREYASDVGQSLSELAVELDKRADTLDPAGSGTAQPAHRIIVE